MDAIRRLGIIGDVHAEDVRLEQALAHLAQVGVDHIVCTGDIVDGRGCPDRALQLLLAHGVSIVCGNHDRWLLEDRVRQVPDAHRRSELQEATLETLASLPRCRELDTVGGRLLLCHGIGEHDLLKVWPGSPRLPRIQSTELDELIASGRYDLLINGHMHFRTLINFQSLILINAGTLRGERWPGFMLADFGEDRLTVFQFVDETIIQLLQMSLSAGTHHGTWHDTRCFDDDWQPMVLNPLESVPQGAGN